MHTNATWCILPYLVDKLKTTTNKPAAVRIAAAPALLGMDKSHWSCLREYPSRPLMVRANHWDVGHGHGWWSMPPPDESYLDITVSGRNRSWLILHCWCLIVCCSGYEWLMLPVVNEIPGRPAMVHGFQKHSAIGSASSCWVGTKRRTGRQARRWLMIINPWTGAGGGGNLGHRHQPRESPDEWTHG